MSKPIQIADYPRGGSLSPFLWDVNRRPSQFASDPKFTYGIKTGKTRSPEMSDVITRITRDTGKNPGTIANLSRAGDVLIEAAEIKRRAQLPVKKRA